MKTKTFDNAFCLRLIGHAGFLILILMSVLLAHERVLFIDSAAQLVEIMQRNGFAVYDNRFTMMVTQLLPLLAYRLGLPMQLIITAYSIAAPVVGYLIFLWIAYGMKDERLALLLLLPLVCMRHTFFHGISETFSLLFYATLLGALLTHLPSRRMWLHLIVTALTTAACVFMHPIGIFFVLFLAGYHLINDHIVPKRHLSPTLLVVLATMLLTGIVKLLTSTAHDATFLPATDEIPGIIRHMGSSEIFQRFLARLADLYIWPIVLFIWLMVFHIRKRHWLQLSYGLLFTFGFFILTIVTYHGSNSTIGVERSFLPFIFFAGYAFIKEVLPTFNPRQTSIYCIVFPLLMLMSFGKIIDSSRHYHRRLDILQSTIEKGRQTGVYKLAANPDDAKCLSNRIQSWATAFETLLLSAENNDEPAVTVFIEEEHQEQTPSDYFQKDRFIATYWWRDWPSRDLPAKYFRIPEQSYSRLLFKDNEPIIQPITDSTAEANPYVTLQDGHFVLNGERWFPFMLNYKAFISDGEVVPAPWYTGRNVREHFDTIASWGFNAVRVCLDAMNEGGDTAAMYSATHRMVQQADSAGLRVMLLIKPPFKGYWRDYAIGLMRRLADLPALWAYDLMNEPLYFDPDPTRKKLDAVKQVREWRGLVRYYAPHQLFTVATAEPIEVFEWDPAMLPVDFIEMHTYHPLRVQAEMWWYSHYCGKPWMVGETGLPADGDSVPYEAQGGFMLETYDYAKFHGAIGYGWWEFQDCPEGVNFEAQYTGLRDRNGNRKLAADMPNYFKYICLGFETDEDLVPPANYYNMLAYQNLAVTGKVTDKKGRPIEGAVVRGWNEDWSVGMNTYTDSTGSFRLVSNDICTHFEISAPRYSREKFDRRSSYPTGLILPDKEREYQQIPLLGWGEPLPLPNGGVQRDLLPTKPKQFEAPTAVEASIGTICLKWLQ